MKSEVYQEIKERFEKLKHSIPYFEKKIYNKVKRKVIEEEVKPLRKRLRETERKIKILEKSFKRIITPSIKLLREIRYRRK
tara:strand:- start:132 stop:374 length:243 start_codon:yes stop_codon:yes gene_type:complete